MSPVFELGEHPEANKREWGERKKGYGLRHELWFPRYMLRAHDVQVSRSL